MKKYVSAVVLACILVSCSKKDITTPETEVTGNIFYRDANIAIADVKGVSKNGSAVEFQFSSLYEKNVVKMELMSGPYENMLCFIHEETIPAASLQRKNYHITEDNANTPTRYYVIKYTLNTGGWVLTPAFKFQQ